VLAPLSAPQRACWRPVAYQVAVAAFRPPACPRRP